VPIGVALAVMVWSAALLRAAVVLAAVMMCRSAQRKGREVRFESRYLAHRLFFYCGPEELDGATLRSASRRLRFSAVLRSYRQ
jgi:hypothetical protein